MEYNRVLKYHSSERQGPSELQLPPVAVAPHVTWLMQHGITRHIRVELTTGQHWGDYRFDGSGFITFYPCLVKE